MNESQRVFLDKRSSSPPHLKLSVNVPIYFFSYSPLWFLNLNLSRIRLIAATVLRHLPLFYFSKLQSGWIGFSSIVTYLYLNRFRHFSCPWLFLRANHNGVVNVIVFLSRKWLDSIVLALICVPFGWSATRPERHRMTKQRHTTSFAKVCHVKNQSTQLFNSVYNDSEADFLLTNCFDPSSSCLRLPAGIRRPNPQILSWNNSRVLLSFIRCNNIVLV